MLRNYSLALSFLSVSLFATSPVKYGVTDSLKMLIYNLFDLGVIKFGLFTLKSGMQSPIYIDLRRTLSSPEVLYQIAIQCEKVVDFDSIDYICGVPYTALPMATVLSMTTLKPMLMRRKEAKTYGTKRSIEGIYEKGMRCLVVEDCFTTGGSALETVKALENEGLIVEQIVIVVDREQGGKEYIESLGYKVKALCTLSEILETLQSADLVSADDALAAKRFIEQNQCYANKSELSSAGLSGTTPNT